MRQIKILQQITNRDESSMDFYLQEISKIPLLTPEEEVLLAKRVKAGDQDAVTALTKANLRFVVSVAKQYQHQGLSLPDLINEGNLGLMKAAQRFDETKGFKFISYAVWWIRQSILQSLAEDSRIIRLPLNKVSIGNKLMKAADTFEQEYEREPSPQELAELVEVSVHEVLEVQFFKTRPASLDAPMRESDSETILLIDCLENDEPRADDSADTDNIASHIREVARTVLKNRPRLYEILKMYFGLEGSPTYSLEEIGDKIGVTRERVRQMKNRACFLIATNKGASKTLRPYL